MTIDLNYIAALLGAVATISAPIIFVLKKYNQILKKLESTESWNRKQQEDIEAAKENNLAQNKALLAMARSMKAKGFNHTIDDAISTLEDTILGQQAKPRSYKGD